MIIAEIYNKYDIPKNLQEHQLKVAAIARYVCERFNEEVDARVTISACLLHDMGNLMKSDFDRFPEFLEPEGREYWEGVREEMSKKYGETSSEATDNMVAEITTDEEIKLMLKTFGVPAEFKTRTQRQLAIATFSDLRVAPHGIVSFAERIRDARHRYVDTKRYSLGYFNDYVRKWEKMRKFILENSKLDENEITEENMAPMVNKMEEFEV